MFNEEWLKNIKIGDKFYTEEFGRYTIYTVKRLTKTEIVTEPFNDVAKDGGRFNRETGHSIGGGAWHTKFAYPLTEGVYKEILRKNRIDKIQAFVESKENFKNINDMDIETIYNMLFKKENKNGRNDTSPTNS